MMSVLNWIWTRGILSTFMAGLFVLLPIALTVAVIGWVGSKLSVLKKPLEWIGLAVDSEGTVAWLVGAVVVLAAIWSLGLIIKATARHKLDDVFHAVLNRVPLVNAIYKPVSQVVGLLKGDEGSDMKGMSVVFCSFGAEMGGGFLGLQASSDTYTIGEQACRLIYIPTSPVPMSGGLVFVPQRSIRPVEMSVDDVMKIYFSLGVLSSQVIPAQYKQPPAQG